jgi:phenylacetate-CoA ligase
VVNPEEDPAFMNETQREVCPVDAIERLGQDEVFATVAAPALAKQLNRVLSDSPFYVDKIARSGMTKADAVRVENLHYWPFTCKAEVLAEQADFPPYGRLNTIPESPMRIHLTSGTSGTPLFIALSAGDVANNLVSGRRAFRCAGLTQADTVVHCLNYCLWSGGLTDHLSLEAVGATVIPFGVGQTKRLIEIIRLLHPTAISCTPSYMARLEVVLREDFGMLPRDLGLRKGFFGGEGGLQNPAVRAAIESTWGISAVDANYGMAEVLSIFGAECSHRSGLHFHGQGILHLELIDPAKGNVLPLVAGATGEMTLTTLLREAQPLVRYRSGDLITILSGDLCSCGRRSLRFRVEGRTDDMIVVRGINVYPAAIKHLLAETPIQYNGQFELVLETPPPFERPLLRVELAEGFRGDEGALATRLAESCYDRLSFTPIVQMLPWGALPRTEGKTRYIRHAYKSLQ